jgi:hypothetical protein
VKKEAMEVSQENHHQMNLFDPESKGNKKLNINQNKTG